MRKTVKTAGALLGSLVLAGALSISAFAMTDGTYTAAAMGMDGDVTVELTVEGDAITDVKVDVSGETPGIGAEIGDTVIQQILDAQSAEIDGVAGATVSSDAVRAAVTDALAQASGEAADTDAELAFTPGTYTETTSGYNGPVEIAVTFDETNVTGIEVVNSAETAQVGERHRH